MVVEADRADALIPSAFGRAGYQGLARHDEYRRWKRMQHPQGEPAIPGETAICTPRLALSALRIGDANEMTDVLDDIRLHEFIGGHPASAAELEDRYRRWVAGPSEPGQRWLNWVVREGAGRRAVGTMQATIKTRDNGRSSADVAWVIATPWQGRGFASEAARAVIEWLTAHGVDDITAHIRPDHHASAAVATKAGLQPTADDEEGETVWRLTRSA